MKEFKIEHSARELISSCDQDIITFEREIEQYEKKLKQLDDKTVMQKVFHFGEIKRRRELFNYELTELRKNIARCKREIGIYETYGTDLPKDHPKYEEMKSLMEARVLKIDTILMVEMGMM